MVINSTAKMLASMVGKKSNAIEISEMTPNDPLTQPQLTPSPDMENALTQILGASYSKKHNPMD